YWNPAGLAGIAWRSAALMHAPYLAESYLDFAAYGQSLGPYGALAAGVQYFSLGGLSQTDSSGVSIGKAQPYDLAAGAGYAYRISDLETPLAGFSLGLAVKYVESKIVTAARTAAVDAGLRSPALFG